jgi:catechol 2,3-dioxygenase
MLLSKKLPGSLEMGAVTLWVTDLELMIQFYRDAVGLDLISETKGVATLGSGSMPLVILEHKPELKHAGPREAGLFHTAILFPTQAALAKAVFQVATQYPGRFTGSADHIVSQAFYFDDPEGNGVELYWDRDRTQWSWVHGLIEMDTLFLDPNEFLKAHLTENQVDQNKKVGHVHLSVGSIEAAEDFYVNKLGFDKTLDWNRQALFVSAGGYHHHMAMNIWRSRGAGRRQLTLGLGNVQIELKSFDQLAETSDRLKFYQLDPVIDEAWTKVSDPWGNQLTLLASAN